MTKRPVPIIAFVLTLVVLAIVSPLLAQNKGRDNSPIVPVIPGTDRSNPDKVFLEHADRLLSHSDVDYQILTGNVQFRRGGMYMYCDSAHFSEQTGNFEAFGNVRMEQGDTLFIYADQLAYEDSIKLAVLYADDGKNVRLINRDVTLETPVFNYDLGIELGYYENVGGKLFDSLNTLTSIDGEYNPTSKEAIFTGRVHLQSRNAQNGDTLEVYTHNLYYNTLTHIAKMDDESTIRNGDGIIYTSQGEYNTESTFAQLFSRSTVVSDMESSRGTTLTADTIFYDRRLGRGEAFGNMIMTDTINKMIMEGDYGYFDSMIDSAFVSGRARVIQYRPVGDGDFDPDKVDTVYVNDKLTRSIETIYLHGDTIRAFRTITERRDTVFLPADPAQSVAPVDSLASVAATVATVAAAVTDSVKAVDNDALKAVSNDTELSIDSVAVQRYNIKEWVDTVRYVVAAPHVKFYRKDMQGLCDSLTFVSTDTMLYMNYSPIVWSDSRQISGDIIKIHLKESDATPAVPAAVDSIAAGAQDAYALDDDADIDVYTADSIAAAPAPAEPARSRMMLDYAFIPTGGFMAEYLEDGFFNQLSGKEMMALFTDGSLSHLDVSGNVLAITFPEENDSTINKVLNIESSFLAADFKENTIERMKLWSETNATVTPLYLAKKSLFFLPAFKWYESFRPLNPDDIFDFPEALQALFDAARGRVAATPAPRTPLPVAGELNRLNDTAEEPTSDDDSSEENPTDSSAKSEDENAD
ncbi:MAG: hypothetical protein HDS69_00360 [Bacteroidales bacterium]|nr:hypothetical protein [Bacteroidales bacterium]MBD5257875.1 hypothetical protein [Barnesiella sp.]